MLRESHNTLQHHLCTFSKLKTKNFNIFIKFAILLSRYIQVNPGPDSNSSDSCGKRVSKRYLCCAKCNVKIHKKCDNMRIFEGCLYNKCKTFLVKRDFSTLLENLPVHQVINKETDHSITSSNIKIPEQTFPENDLVWKVFKNKSLHFGHLNIKSILPKREQLRYLLINSNISAHGVTEKKKLDNTVNNEEVEIDGYKFFRSDRNRKRGAIACYIKTSISFNYHRRLTENFENILIDILLPKSKSVTLDIIYRPPDQSSFIDDFNIALKELASEGNKMYFLGDFDILFNFFFEGHYVLKKSYAKLKEAQSNQTLLKPYLEIYSAFGLTQIINKPTRSTLKISSVLDHILINLKESCNSAWCYNIRVIRS